MDNYKNVKKIRGIITADVIGSTQIPTEKRDLLPKTLRDLENELQKVSPIRLEMYRGDSFQVVVDRYEKTMFIATLLRLGLKKQNIGSPKMLDARMSVGIGTIEYENPSVGQSDGEAFVLSGRAFETIGKKRLIAQTNNQGLNDELQILTLVLDELLTSVSKRQSEVVYEQFINPKEQQKMIAKTMGVKPSVISKSLHAARAKVIIAILSRMEIILTNY